MCLSSSQAQGERIPLPSHLAPTSGWPRSQNITARCPALVFVCLIVLFYGGFPESKQLRETKRESVRLSCALSNSFYIFLIKQLQTQATLNQIQMDYLLISKPFRDGPAFLVYQPFVFLNLSSVYYLIKFFVALVLIGGRGGFLF